MKNVLRNIRGLKPLTSALFIGSLLLVVLLIPVPLFAGFLGETELSRALVAPAFGIFKLASWFLGFIGVIFNYAVLYLVFQFGTTFGTSAGMLAAWGVLRDVGNIILLFGFVYIGIQTILNIGHFSVGKALPRILIAAVLLNFSLFIAGAVIDVTNVFAASLYNQTYLGECPASQNADARGSCALNYGLSGAIARSVSLGSVYNISDSNWANEITLLSEVWPAFVKFLGLAFILFVLAIVLLFGAALLVARAIHLALLMVTSPVAFAGMAMPPLEKFSQDWWHQLINQGLFAPVFLILLFIGLKLSEELARALNTGTGAGIAEAIGSTSSSSMGILLLYVLVIGFLIASLLAAKKFGVYGADTAVKTATGIVGGTAGALTFGLGGMAFRNTVGAGSNALASRIARSGFGGTEAGRLVAGVIGAPAKMSGDARSLGIAGGALGKVSKDAQGGIKGVIDAAAKKRAHWDEEREEADGEEFKRLALKAEGLVKKNAPSDVDAEGNPVKPKFDAKTFMNATHDDKASQDLQKQMLATVAGKEVLAKDLKTQVDPAKKANTEVENRVNPQITQLTEELEGLRETLETTNLTPADRRDDVWESARADLEGLIAERSSSLETLETERAASNKKLRDIQSSLHKLEEQIHEQQGAYAEDLRKMSERMVTLGPRNRRAIENSVAKIRKAHKESPEDKVLDKLKKQLKGETHAPAAAAAPTPANNAPAAAADDHGHDAAH